MYYYDGNLRLALFFANPNYEGALYTAFAFVFLALVAFCLRRRHWCGIAVGLFFGGCAALSVVLLALTYSRGSYVAFGGVSLAAAICGWWRERRRVLHFWLPVAFLLLVLCVPSGGKRVGSIASPREDLSIANRLTLWRGGTIVLTHHWLTGLGADCVSPAHGYTVWLQPLEKNEIYRAFISDVVTTAVCRGLPVTGAIFTVMLWLFLGVFDIWRKSGRMDVLWMLCAPVAFLVCGIFNTCCSEPILVECFIALNLILAVMLVIAKCRHCPTHLLRNAIVACAVSALGCVTLFAIGVVTEQTAPWTVAPIPVDGQELPSRICLTPRKCTVVLREVLFFSDNVEGCARSALLPLASHGVRVQAFPCDGGTECLETLKAQLTEAGGLADGVVVVGHGFNAANAVCGALQSLEETPRNVRAVFWQIDMHHPVRELAPQPQKLNIPAMFFSDDGSASEWSERQEDDVRFFPCDETMFLKVVAEEAGRK
ncbi:MAG: O-antigen ligase family protein [Lentisphaeria bacterium]|nr:O-antigen ligase family protein [Lentisphaeria bacterium]